MAAAFTARELERLRSAVRAADLPEVNCPRCQSVRSVEVMVADVALGEVACCRECGAYGFLPWQELLEVPRR
jgi:transcription elongation factor Elf1